jgi:hypothetical protein
MRADVTQVLQTLRASHRPEFGALMSAAHLDDPVPPPPHPDAVEPYRWLLQRLGDGLKLTAAGWLPPAVVVETMQRFGWDAKWIGKGNREDLTPPVAELRATARLLGLVRVYRGQLKCTDAGRRLRDDPVGLWWHIAAHLPLGRSEPERQAGLLWLLTVAASAARPDQLVADGMWLLGWAQGRTGSPLDRYQALGARRDTSAVFDRLGLLGSRRELEDLPTEAAVDLARAALRADDPAPAAPRRPAEPVPALELEITLRDVEPRVWRRIVVPEAVTLRQLHDLLQVAMGWQDSHLYLFAIGDREYGDIDDFDELGSLTTTLATVVDPGAVFRYDYDFGDGWEHDVRVVRRTTSDGAHCLDGARACPPEGCGGPHGYARLLDVLADSTHPEHADLADWLGHHVDPEAFDRDAVDAALRATPRRGRH